MVLHGAHLSGISVGRVIAILAFIAVSAYLDVVHVSADHISKKESRVYLEEIDREYKDGTLSAEDYKAKLQWLEDHDAKLGEGSDVKKDVRSVSWAILSTLISIIVVGAFFAMRIRLRNRSHEQTQLLGGKKMGMAERLRDKNRDTLTQSLNAMGIQATMLDRGRAEEKIREKTMGIFGSSLGIIQVDGDRIPWINVVRLRRQDKNGPAKYRAVFGIPDPTLPVGHHPLEIKTVRKKSFPLFGKVIDVHWEARDALAPLVNVFSQDEAIINFVKDVGDIAVHTHPRQFQGWTVEVTTLHKVFTPVVFDQWQVIHKIAEYVIASPRD